MADAMQYINVVNIEKYQDGYKDRRSIWCKIYFTLFHLDWATKTLSEIDQRRYILFIALQVESQKATPIDPVYLGDLGCDFVDKSLDDTIATLEGRGLIQVIDTPYVTEDSTLCNGEHKSPSPREEKRREEKNKKEDVPYDEIIADLNTKTGKNFRPVGKACELIRARWDEGAAVDDFKHVHRTMTGEWLDDEKMSKYLRPSTLYNKTKFWDYHGQERQARRMSASDERELENSKRRSGGNNETAVPISELIKTGENHG